MAIKLQDQVQTQAPKPSDYRCGAWTSTTEANSSIISGERYIGLTVGVITGQATTSGAKFSTAEGGTQEYWY